MPGTHAIYKDTIPAGETVVLESNFQLIVTERYTIEAGATLWMMADSKLVVIP